MAQDKTSSLAGINPNQFAADVEALSEKPKADTAHHDEILGRQDQDALDAMTAQLVSERRKYSIWATVILGVAMLATVASMLFQK